VSVLSPAHCIAAADETPASEAPLDRTLPQKLKKGSREDSWVRGCFSVGSQRVEDAHHCSEYSVPDSP
jgi:hypothetical protein